MSDGDAEGEVTPRASHRASSPERTPGRSPEGHVAFLLQEAEERSQRRAAAIRHVLDSIRIAPPLPPGRRAEARPTDDFEGGPSVDSEGDSGGGVRSSQESTESTESTTLEELLPRVAPQAVTGPDNPQEMLEVWKTRCERLEKALESCQLEAQESLETSQAELAAVEGRVAKREAELRQEIIDLRSEHFKEREKWRAEGKRLQSSLKETQRRAKAESEAKCAATEQVEVLRQQLARLDSKRSEKEAKHSEEMKQRHAEFLRWVASQCATALGEALDTNVSEEVTRQLLSNLVTSRGRQLQGRLQAEVKTERSEPSEMLHTEWRGRVRAAEQAQKKMQRLMQKEAEAHEAQREMQTEEMVELKLRVNALQRAKEVSERFVEEEEECWLRSKAQLREAETEVLSAMASARHYEAEARMASGDAVRAQAKATGAEAQRRRLQAEVESLQREAQRSPPPLQDLGKVQQSWRDTAALEEVSEAQRQMGHWRNEAERSCAELTKLRASCEQLQLQSTEQAKVEEAKRRLMQQALKEQAQEMQREFDQALREVQDLRDKQSFQLQEKAQELCDKEHTVSMLTSELEDLRSKQVESDSRLEQLQDELSKSADLLHSSEASMRVWQNEVQQQKEQLSEEVFELHQSYAKRLQNLRAQQGGEKRAFQAVEDELRQIYTEEVQVCRRNQEAWAEATEAAFTGEVAEARLARMAVEESESAALRHETQVQEKLQEQLVMLKNHLGGEFAPTGLHPASHELFKQLCVSIEVALCDEVRGNPCSELRRTLRRDLKQELRDQLRSEVHSVRRCREASTGSTTGSSARRVKIASRESPPSAVRQELTRRGAALMEAFTAAAEAGLPPME